MQDSKIRVTNILHIILSDVHVMIQATFILIVLLVMIRLWLIITISLIIAMKMKYWKKLWYLLLYSPVGGSNTAFFMLMIIPIIKK